MPVVQTEAHYVSPDLCPGSGIVNSTIIQTTEPNANYCMKNAGCELQQKKEMVAL